MTLTVYFVTGMIMNYRSTGSATIPHVDFWRGLPVLIKDGAAYSKTRFMIAIGREDGAPRYQDFGAASRNIGGYGSV